MMSSVSRTLTGPAGSYGATLTVHHTTDPRSGFTSDQPLFTQRSEVTWAHCQAGPTQQDPLLASLGPTGVFPSQPNSSDLMMKSHLVFLRCLRLVSQVPTSRIHRTRPPGFSEEDSVCWMQSDRILLWLMSEMLGPVWW